VLGFFTKKFRARIAWERRSPTRSTHSIPAFVLLQTHFAFFRVDRCGQRFQIGPVNSNFAGKSRRFGNTSYEALRMKLVGHIEHFLALPQNVFRLAIVHHRRRKQAQAGVAMFLVVPTKQSLTDSSAILNAPETVREFRPILQGAELAFRVRIVVRDVRPTMRLGHSQIDQQKRRRLGAHGGAAIGMQRKLLRNVRHFLLLQKVARRVQDDEVMRLLKMILKATGKKGVPQGG
jgi:hypothetical protein